MRLVFLAVVLLVSSQGLMAQQQWIKQWTGDLSSKAVVCFSKITSADHVIAIQKMNPSLNLTNRVDPIGQSNIFKDIVSVDLYELYAGNLYANYQFDLKVFPTEAEVVEYYMQKLRDKVNYYRDLKKSQIKLRQHNKKHRIGGIFGWTHSPGLLMVDARGFQSSKLPKNCAVLPIAVQYRRSLTESEVYYDDRLVGDLGLMSTASRVGLQFHEWFVDYAAETNQINSLGVEEAVQLVLSLDINSYSGTEVKNILIDSGVVSDPDKLYSNWTSAYFNSSNVSMNIYWTYTFPSWGPLNRERVRRVYGSSTTYFTESPQIFWVNDRRLAVSGAAELRKHNRNYDLYSFELYESFKFPIYEHEYIFEKNMSFKIYYPNLRGPMVHEGQIKGSYKLDSFVSIHKYLRVITKYQGLQGFPFGKIVLGSYELQPEDLVGVHTNFYSLRLKKSRGVFTTGKSAVIPCLPSATFHKIATRPLKSCKLSKGHMIDKIWYERGRMVSFGVKGRIDRGTVF